MFKRVQEKGHAPSELQRADNLERQDRSARILKSYQIFSLTPDTVPKGVGTPSRISGNLQRVRQLFRSVCSLRVSTSWLSVIQGRGSSRKVLRRSGLLDGGIEL